MTINFLKKFHIAPMVVLISVLPGIVNAEGGVRVLECNVVQTCDTDGHCDAASGSVTFHMAPVELNADGSGTYRINYDDKEAAMEALSDAGPFYWATGNERNTLLASSETRFLWHQLTFTTAPVTTIRFLDCEFHQ